MNSPAGMRTKRMPMPSAKGALCGAARAITGGAKVGGALQPPSHAAAHSASQPRRRVREKMEDLDNMAECSQWVAAVSTLANEGVP